MPNIGMSRCRNVWMKSSRHLTLLGSSPARNDLGNPPRTDSSAYRSTPVSASVNPVMSTKCTRPASVSEDFFIKSGDALPSKRNRLLEN